MMRVERTMAERVMREDEAPERMEDDMGREDETPVRKVGRWVERR